MIKWKVIKLADLMSIENIVFTRIKALFSEKLKEKYTNLYFTTSSKAQTEPSFPTIYVHELGSVEQGQDLDNTSINAILSTFQVEVFDNQNQTRATEVMTEVVRIMKGMRFSVNVMPYFDDTDIYRKVARFRRIIGDGDTL